MKETQTFRKKLYSVEFIKEPEGIEIHNFLENSDYKTEAYNAKNPNDPTATNNIHMIGTIKEEWVCNFKSLNNSYNLADLNIFSPEDIEEGKKYTVFTKDPEHQPIVFAYQTDEPSIVKTAWGTKLEAKVGDWIIFSRNPDDPTKPNFNDSWVIDSQIFEKTMEKVNI